jgi:hypothetical protein
MLWIKWIKGEPATILTKVPHPGRTAGLRSSCGWLLGKDGGLKQVCTGFVDVLIPYPLILSARWMELRSKGPARLRGVLHYFTRGPD